MRNFRFSGWKKVFYIVSVLVLAFAAVLLLLSYIFTGDTLRKGIIIENTDISWKSEEEARQLVLEDLKRNYHGENLKLSYKGKQWIVGLEEIQYRFMVDNAVKQAFSLGRTGSIIRDVYNSLLLSLNGQRLNVGVEYNKEKIKYLLQKIKKDCDVAGKNASISYEKGSVKFTKETIGKNLDIDINTNLIENQLLKRDFGIIELQVENAKPYIMYDDIKEINGVVSHYNTKLTSDKNRTENIKLACSRIDNRILMPGEEFSMNEALGPRTLENGYKQAPIILKNELVEGTGGGVCQVSSTLYNTVLLAGLEITERVHHSIPLTYISPGRDATINEDSIDFRFINSSDYPICLQADISGRVLNINILSRKKNDGETVKLKIETLEEFPPEEDEVIFDNSLPYGETVVERKAVNGVRVRVYREFYKNGVITDIEKISEDYYKPVRGKIRVGRDMSRFNYMYGGYGQQRLIE